MSQMPTKYRVTHNGEPLAFGRVFFTISSGNTPAVTYQNAGLTSANTNPVVSDENGEANVYLDSFTYRETVYDQHGVLIRTRDGIQGDVLTSASADSRYVVKGSASSIGVTTREVISNVRTYVGTLTGFSAYTAGAMIGIIPDVVAGADTAYYININGLGDRRIYSSIGGKPSLTVGVASSLVFDGGNFIVTASVALLSNQSSLDIVKAGTTETTKVVASVTAGTGKLEATYSAGDSTLVLKGHSVSVDTENNEDFTVNGEVVATQDYVQDELFGNAALWSAINEKIPLSQKGAVFGVATLDENQKVPPYQLPAIGGSGDVGAFNTISEFTADAGVTVDEVRLKDGSISLGGQDVFANVPPAKSFRVGARNGIWDNPAGAGIFSLSRGVELQGSGTSWSWKSQGGPNGTVFSLFDDGSSALQRLIGGQGSTAVATLVYSFGPIASTLNSTAGVDINTTRMRVGAISSVGWGSSIVAARSGAGDADNMQLVVASTTDNTSGIGFRNLNTSGMLISFAEASGAGQTFAFKNYNGSGYLPLAASAFNVNSDITLKDIEGNLSGSLDFLMRARTVKGRWKYGEEKGLHSWFIAQDWTDYEGVLYCGSPDEEGNRSLQMNYIETIPVVASAVKELADKVALLEAQIADLISKGAS